jgi:hypothetical protein
MCSHSLACRFHRICALLAIALLAALLPAAPVAHAVGEENGCAPLPPTEFAPGATPEGALFAAYLATCYITDMSLAPAETKHFALKLYPGVTTVIGAVPMGPNMRLGLTVTPPVGANVSCTGSSSPTLPAQSDGFLLCGTTTDTQQNFVASVTATAGSGRFLIYEIRESVAVADVGMYSVRELVPANVTGHTLKLYKIAKDSRVITMKLRVKEGGPDMYAQMYGRNGQKLCASSSLDGLDSLCNVSLTGVDTYYVLVLNASTQMRTPKVRLQRV